MDRSQLLEDARSALAFIRLNPSSPFSMMRRMEVQAAMEQGISLEEIGATPTEWKILMRPSIIRAFRSRIMKALTHPEKLGSTADFFQSAVETWGVSVSELIDGLDQEYVNLLISGLMMRRNSTQT